MQIKGDTFMFWL